MRRRHKARHAAHERAHLALSVPHVRRDRSFPAAQPSPARPIPTHLRRKQVRTVFCIMTCFISQSEFDQEASKSGAAVRGETWSVRAGTHTALTPIVRAQGDQRRNLFTYMSTHAGCWFSRNSLSAVVKVRVSSIFSSG